MVKKGEKLFNKPLKVLLLIVIALGLAIILILVFNKSDRSGGVDFMGNFDDFEGIENAEIIFGIEIDGKYKAYKEIELNENQIIEDKFNEVDIKIEKLEDGTVIVIRLDNGSEIMEERESWLVWYALHPETELYKV